MKENIKVYWFFLFIANEAISIFFGLLWYAPFNPLNVHSTYSVGYFLSFLIFYILPATFIIALLATVVLRLFAKKEDNISRNIIFSSFTTIIIVGIVTMISIWNDSNNESDLVHDPFALLFIVLFIVNSIVIFNLNRLYYSESKKVSPKISKLDDVDDN